jgi:hypothetical protein
MPCRKSLTSQLYCLNQGVEQRPCRLNVARASTRSSRQRRSLPARRLALTQVLASSTPTPGGASRSPSTSSCRPGRGRLLRVRPRGAAHLPQGRLRGYDRWPCLHSLTAHARAGRDDAAMGTGAPEAPERRSKGPGKSSSPIGGGQGLRAPHQTTGQARPHEHWRRRCAKNACRG